MPKLITIVPTIILGIILIAGLLNAIAPKLMWKTFESWKAKSEPPNIFFISRRIVGIVVVIIVFAIFLLPYLMNR